MPSGPASGKSEVYRQPKVDFDPAQYEVSQVFYASKDGTKVPMFLAHKKGITKDGSNPTYLYGYGGFNAAITPYFSVADLTWMEMGGVLAVANLRGGGEYGDEWHKQGNLTKKQNVFDDFAAVCTHMVNTKYTSRERLAIQVPALGSRDARIAMVMAHATEHAEFQDVLELLLISLLSQSHASSGREATLLTLLQSRMERHYSRGPTWPST